MISIGYPRAKWNLAALVMRLAALVFSSPIAMWKLQNEFRVPTPRALLGAAAAAATD
jgi:hypothetical protein